MKHTKNFIFPTIIHLFDNVLEQEYIDSMKRYIIKGKNMVKTQKLAIKILSYINMFKYKANLVEKAINVCSKNVFDDNNFDI